MTERKSKTAKRKQTEAARAALAKKRAGSSKPAAASKSRKQKTDAQRLKHNTAAKKSYQRGKAECGDAVKRVKWRAERPSMVVWPKNPDYTKSKKYKDVKLLPGSDVIFKGITPEQKKNLGVV
jgi:hypothetical protein